MTSQRPLSGGDSSFTASPEGTGGGSEQPPRTSKNRRIGELREVGKVKQGSWVNGEDNDKSSKRQGEVVF